MSEFIVSLLNRPNVSVQQGYTRAEVAKTFKEFSEKQFPKIIENLDGMTVMGETMPFLMCMFLIGTKEQAAKLEKFLKETGIAEITCTDGVEITVAD